MSDGRSFEIQISGSVHLQWRQKYQLAISPFWMKLLRLMPFLSVFAFFMVSKLTAEPTSSYLNFIVIGLSVTIILNYFVLKIGNAHFNKSKIRQRANEGWISRFEFGIEGINIVSENTKSYLSWKVISLIKIDASGVLFGYYDSTFFIDRKHFEDKEDMEKFAVKCRDLASSDLVYVDKLK